MGKLSTAEVRVQIDVGVGDVVTPAPETVIFPVRLDFPAPRVRTYSVYAVGAEKTEVMVKLGTANIHGATPLISPKSSMMISLHMALSFQKVGEADLKR